MRERMTSARNPRPKTISKSFRIDENASGAVEKEATTLNVSTNTLVNQILKQFSEFDRFARRMNTVKLSGSVFRSLLEQIEPDKIIEVAKAAGSSIPQAFVISKSGKVAVDSLLDYVRSSAMYAHLFEFTETDDGQKRLVTLVHDFGLNWSIFLVHYVTAMFQQVGIAPKLEMSDRSVTFAL
jgi:hypothetical protein